MSYDVIYICQDGDSNGWRNNRRLNAEDSHTFDVEAEKLYKAGNFVVLSAGRNFMHEEIFLFERVEDAVCFYDTGYKARESTIDEISCGFEEVALYLSGRKVTTKSDEGGAIVESQSMNIQDRICWDECFCDTCPEPATHVGINQVSYSEHDQVEDYLHFCGACYTVNVVDVQWVHKPEGPYAEPEESDDNR
jgi:hypothetical protein